MNAVTGSALTAFLITSGSAFGIAEITSKGNNPGFWAIAGCLAAGLVAGAKDYRSSMRLPPVQGPAPDDQETFALPNRQVTPITVGTNETTDQTKKL